MNPPICTDDLLEAMRAGEVSLADTARAAQESPEAQRTALNAVRCGRAPTLTAALTPDEPASGEQLTIELNAEETADLDAIVAHYQARQPRPTLARARSTRCYPRIRPKARRARRDQRSRESVTGSLLETVPGGSVTLHDAPPTPESKGCSEQNRAMTRNRLDPHANEPNNGKRARRSNHAEQGNKPIGYGKRKRRLDRQLHLGNRQRRAARPLRPRQVPRRHPPDDGAPPAGRGPSRTPSRRSST